MKKIYIIKNTKCLIRQVDVLLSDKQIITIRGTKIEAHSLLAYNLMTVIKDSYSSIIFWWRYSFDRTKKL